ncbi:MAG: hypothetical protein ACYC1D_15500 [Acidimicrobiales bacterium]
MVLAADYVAQHVELAYATTAHRAQGRTTDTAHAMVAPTTTRENLYVAATRGRESNQLYVDVAYDPDPATSHDGMVEAQSASDVLAGVLANEGADISAHETMRRAAHQADDLTALSAQYQTLARPPRPSVGTHCWNAPDWTPISWNRCVPARRTDRCSRPSGTPKRVAWT